MCSMNVWKKFFLQVLVLVLYMTGVAFIGYGLLALSKSAGFIFFGIVSIYVGICVFNILEGSK